MTTLRNVLMINAITSGITGLILVAVPGFVANLFATSNTTVLVGVGIFLVAFAAMVFITSLQHPLSGKTVSLIVVLDALWVLTSLGIIMLQLLDVSTLGYFLIGGVAAWVALMAYLQFNAMRQLSTKE
jgi:hypothetical protein